MIFSKLFFLFLRKPHNYWNKCENHVYVNMLNCRVRKMRVKGFFWLWNTFFFFFKNAHNFFFTKLKYINFVHYHYVCRCYIHWDICQKFIWEVFVPFGNHETKQKEISLCLLQVALLKHAFNKWISLVIFNEKLCLLHIFEVG